eukprot:1628710-Alexandrium_andersonii.AAC.1
MRPNLLENASKAVSGQLLARRTCMQLLCAFAAVLLRQVYRHDCVRHLSGLSGVERRIRGVQVLVDVLQAVDCQAPPA